MTEPIALEFVGSDTGIARLITELEEAGASRVTAEPGETVDENLEIRNYAGEIVGLEPQRAIDVGAAYLATTHGHRVLLNGIEVPLPT